MASTRKAALITGAANGIGAAAAIALAKAGYDVAINYSRSDDQAREIYPDGWESPKPYIRIVPQPTGK